jgi:trimeric autotransporter adhesin
LKIMVARSTRRPSFRSKLRAVEVLESRELLATFSVTNLQNSGAGSLRQAIIDSNAQPGGNTIDFDVAGTIRISKSSLPAITDPVIIDGSTAPSFAGSPVVTVDFQATKGLNFAAGSDGSTLKSLSLVKAGSSGVTLNASRITIQGNYIGLQANGKTVAGNRGDGIQINASSHGDMIGQENPVSSIDYYSTETVSTSNNVSMPVSGLAGHSCV